MIKNSINISQLLYEEESNTLDFKQEQYRFSGATDQEKSELLKDILAFANSWRRTDAYILIGVKEKKGQRSELIGVSDHLDDANLQQFVNSKTQRPLDFSYKTIEFEGVMLGLIKIPVQKRPLYLKKDYGLLKKDSVYIRRGSSTTIATLDEVSTMGSEINRHIESMASLEAFLVYGEHEEFVEKKCHCTLTNFKVPKAKDIPDYGIKKTRLSDYTFEVPDMLNNKDFYRERVEYWRKNSIVHAFKIGIKNTGRIPIRDVKVVFNILNENNSIIVCKVSDLPKQPTRSSLLIRNLHEILSTKNDVSVKSSQDGWRVICELGKIQPKDMVSTMGDFYLGSTETKLIKIEAQIFSDDLAEPKNETFEVFFNVDQKTLTISDICTD